LSVVHDLTVPVADIIGSPGKYRDIAIDAGLPEVANALARVGEEPVRARLRAESVVEGILVSGRVEGVAATQCARCLDRRTTTLQLEVCELFVGPGSQADEDAYRLSGTEMDLRPLLVDAVALALPLRPLCRDDCKGLCPRCGRNLNLGSCSCAAETTDVRWAPLEGLRERLEST
jgi:uncharacterized protein